MASGEKFEQVVVADLITSFAGDVELALSREQQISRKMREAYLHAHEERHTARRKLDLLREAVQYELENLPQSTAICQRLEIAWVDSAY